MSGEVKKETAAAVIVGEARALLERYEPETGVGYSLASPSQGECRRMLASIRALLTLVSSVPKVEHQEVALKTR